MSWHSQTLLRLGAWPLVALALSSGPGAGSARAETIHCTPMASFPITITSPGVYCVTSDFGLNMADGFAITVATNNVVIDLNGYKIGNLAAGRGTRAIGIYANQQKNITIKNGTLRGFSVGIYLRDESPYTTAQGNVVEDMRIDQSTFIGLGLLGEGNLARRNLVAATGGTTGVAAANGYGIYVNGNGNRVLRNEVIGVEKTGSGTAYGTYVLGTNSLVAGNRLSAAEEGVRMLDSSIKYFDNVTTSVTTPYAGGADAGNNH